jgi:hypothetical protein
MTPPLTANSWQPDWIEADQSVDRGDNLRHLSTRSAQGRPGGGKAASRRPPYVSAQFRLVPYLARSFIEAQPPRRRFKVLDGDNKPEEY